MQALAWLVVNVLLVVIYQTHPCTIVLKSLLDKF